MTNKEAAEQLKNYHYEDGTVPQEIILAIKALEEHDDLLERAYGHVVGQGANGVIREKGAQ